jgi:chromosome segregation ATPase
LSAWLLEELGLGRTKLRVTEGNPNSPAHDLSIRDVMWIAFLPSGRLDNQALLHEGHAQKQYKLRQVIEVAFGVHDNRLAQLLDQLKQLRDERKEYEREVAALETFLREEEVPGTDALAAQRSEVDAARGDVDARLTALTADAKSSTDYAADLPARYGRARSSAARAAARVRDREALLERLLPLRAQYAQDER